MGFLGILENEGKAENTDFRIIGRQERPGGKDHVGRSKLGASMSWLGLPYS